MFPLLVPDELMDKLDANFGRVPDASMTHREIDHWIGERRVLDCIRRWHAEQREALS
jgi:hypothetical protein